jgi:hypothetical protein
MQSFYETNRPPKKRELDNKTRKNIIQKQLMKSTRMSNKWFCLHFPRSSFKLQTEKWRILSLFEAKRDPLDSKINVVITFWRLVSSFFKSRKDNNSNNGSSSALTWHRNSRVRLFNGSVQRQQFTQRTQTLDSIEISREIGDAISSHVWEFIICFHRRRILVSWFSLKIHD